MKQLREVAYDAEDCIDLYTLRIESRRTDGVRAWLGRLLGKLRSRRRLACEIGALRARARAVAISERHARFASTGTRCAGSLLCYLGFPYRRRYRPLLLATPTTAAGWSASRIRLTPWLHG